MSRIARAIQVSAVAWLVLLAWPVYEQVHADPKPLELVVTLGALGVYVGMYVWLWLTRVPGRISWPTLLAVMSLIGIAIGLNLALRAEARWMLLFAYAVITPGFVLPARIGILMVVFTTAVGTLTFFVLQTKPPPDLSYPPLALDLNIALQGLLLGLGAAGVGQLVKTNSKLEAARAEIASLAIEAERQRFSRDLHDLLGHSLSLIALKAELAGRLVFQDASASAAEMRDVEQAARRALGEVREAVTGYRSSTLSAELDGARAALSAASIELAYKHAAGPLPADVEEVLSWALREGVTNLLRHSQARRCTISVSRRDGQAHLEIADDGRGSDMDRPSLGLGLRGLNERVSNRGGRLVAHALPGRGFRLAVSMPVAGS